MTKEALAARLDGQASPFEVPKALAAEARRAGLVIVYGASDDLLELRGALEEEIPAYGGTDVLITPDGLWDETSCGERCCHYLAAQVSAEYEGQHLLALWNPGEGYSWQYRTAIPHATFEIVEDGAPYCRGLVFALADVGKKGGD